MTLRFLTAGESHGPGLTAILEGFPSGVQIDLQAIQKQMQRRQGGFGRGGRMKIEKDRVEFTAGVRHGRTLGSPLALHIPNRDFQNWQTIMSPFGPPPDPAKRVVTTPRPGHADYSGGAKHRFDDLRNVLERASARETAARVAVGSVARQLLAVFGVEVTGRTLSIGGINDPTRVPQDVDYSKITEQAEQNDLSVLSAGVYADMVREIESARHEKDTLGGVVEVIVLGLPPGIGSHVHWDRKLDGLLAQAIMSIPAVKGVEIGAAFENARLRGSAVHDAMKWDDQGEVTRTSNRAGGLEGGITNAQPLVLRAAMKPISTLMNPLDSVDLKTGAAAKASVERSDTCAVAACGVVAEAMVSFVLAAQWLERFGGDHLPDIQAAFHRDQQEVRRWTRLS